MNTTPLDSQSRRDFIKLSAEVHHKKLSFQEEFVALLKKHQIEYDERYLWE